MKNNKFTRKIRNALNEKKLPSAFELAAFFASQNVVYRILIIAFSLFWIFFHVMKRMNEIKLSETGWRLLCSLLAWDPPCIVLAMAQKLKHDVNIFFIDQFAMTSFLKCVKTGEVKER